MKELIREEKIHMQIHYLGHILWLWAPIKYYVSKLLTLDKEDKVMIYVCSYSHRSYIVIDPPTCGACPISLLAKNPHQVEILPVHPKTLNPISCYEIPLYLPMDWIRCFK